MHSWCVERYGDMGNTAEVQEARMVAWELEANAELERLRAAGTPAALPAELVLVVRVAALLRGLGLSLQYNIDIGERWKPFAEQTIANNGAV